MQKKLAAWPAQLFKALFGALDKKVLADTEALYAARLSNLRLPP